ncbi:ThuA domain-containing protein [Chiayiivirga flava]|uniref:Type 1 glutamine amidotransferase n=1 Tax=Chiayiivirga flava TaxID=659595 RepID=A0A7W8FZN5_9GAMM|nr:type 1 glutamine amidotransferase [Chiayiivirga flava]
MSRLVALLLAAVSCAGVSAQTVVLIGGPASEGPGRHDYPVGVRTLQTLLESSPDAAHDLRVTSYPDGWPENPHALDAADTVLWYFDGNNAHPLRDASHRAAWERALQRGVGVIALHQASTVPVDDDLGVPRALGAARRGLYDRTTEWTRLEAATATHPLLRGVGAIEYRDEFYPTVQRDSTARPTTPILSATLHPQFRDGHALLDDVAERHPVAWAFERDDGGRAFVFTGAHFSTAFDQPGLRTLLLNAVAWTARREVPAYGLRAAAPARAEPPRAAPRPARTGAVATFHGDRARSGWHADETVLSPDIVADANFGQVWESPPLDGADGTPARLYASPLHVDGVTMSQGPHRGETFAAVFAATNHGDVIAVNAARSGDLAPGRILWRTRLGDACRLQPAPLDGVPTGILSTPIVDIGRGVLYVTHCDPVSRWQAYAIDIASGAVLPGWPVTLDEDTFNTLNRNAGPTRVPPKRRFDFRVQRGALNLSPDGSRLYVVFGESETGWLVSVDTTTARVASAFAAVAMPHRGSGGIWGAGGPAVDARGRVHVVTGSGFDGHQQSAHDWTQSLLQLTHDADGFTLRGTYTPFNHCTSAKMDIDLGAGGAMLLPSGNDDAMQLLAVGGKQGNVYLLDADRLPGRLDHRPPCTTDASTDASLLPPQTQPQFGTRGPLNVFGPYSEDDAALDLARARSVPASFRAADGRLHLFVTGNTKRATGSAESIPPSLVRLEVAGDADAPYLRIAAANDTVVFGNPGSPVVTSNGARDAVVWVLDENAPRSALLAGDDAPQPVLYAFSADDLRVLWRSAPGALFTSGKYNTPGFGGGQVFVGTDRIQAFGSGGRSLPHRTRATAVVPVAAPAADGLDGAAIYRQRCAACHDNPVGNIPPRSVIASRPHARIVEALTHGVMRVHATGLSAEQIEDVARFLQ